jgi:hypothetical protein
MEGVRARLNEQIARKVLASRFDRKDVNYPAMRHVALFPGIQLAYNRIKKNANTSTMTYLRNLEASFCQTVPLAKRDSLHITSAPLKEIARLSSYTFFAIVRNPYTRVLSAFLDKFNREKYVRQFGAFELTPAGFHEFIDWLQEGGLELDKHWDLQTKIMLMPLDEFDAVVRFENYDEDMSKFIALKKLEHIASDFVRPGKSTGASTHAASFYTPEIAAKVYRMFEPDFDALSYPRQLPGT